MTLGFLARGLVLVLAGHAVVSTIAAVGVVVLWPRVRRPLDASAVRFANRLFLVRMAPLMASLAVAWCGLAVSYALWEPRTGDERVGPMSLTLAATGAALVASGLWRAGRSVLSSRRIQHRLLTCAQVPQPHVSVPAIVVESAFPIVALAGVFMSRLFVARTVVEACTADELRAILAHEHAHEVARDNLRRLTLEGSPDILGWMRAATAFDRDWAAAAELAADEAAAVHAPARLHLASALVKVARLATTPPDALPASAFYAGDALTERVRRLLDAPVDAGAPVSPWPGCLVTLAILVGAPVWMSSTYAAFEALLAVGLP